MNRRIKIGKWNRKHLNRANKYFWKCVGYNLKHSRKIKKFKYALKFMHRVGQPIHWNF